MLMAFSLLNKSLLDNVILLYGFETFDNKKNFFSHGTLCLYLQSSPELPMEWDLQFGAPWTNERGRCQIRKLGSDFANPNMMLIIALICQIFSPKSQLIWLFFKLPIKSLLLYQHSFTISQFFLLLWSGSVALPIPSVGPLFTWLLLRDFPPTSCPVPPFLRTPHKASNSPLL